MGTQKQALDLAYKCHKKYTGSVYIGIHDKVNDKFTEQVIPIEKLSDALQQLRKLVGKKDVYISKNAFKSFFTYGRSYDNLFSLNNIVVDLDFHKAPVDLRDSMIIKTVSILDTELFTFFPVASMIHYTGRGLHLWWCFDSVSHNMRLPYEIVVERLLGKIDDILSSHTELIGLEVDSGMTTNTCGYARVPCSYNSEAGKNSIIEFRKEVPYTLQTLIDASNSYLDFVWCDSCVVSESDNSSVKAVKNKKKWASFTYQYIRRMELVENLVSHRTSFIGNRHYGCFIYYNCARGVYSKEEARKLTSDLNKKFDEQLDVRELNSIFKSVDTRFVGGGTTKEGCSGPFWLKNSYIIDHLHITKEEQEQFNFQPKLKGDISDMKPNRTRDLENQIKRKTRDENIIGLYVSSDLTQKEVAEIYGCSVPTVNSILKKNGVNRKEIRIELIQLMKSEGIKQTEVAKWLNICLRTVKTYWNLPDTL